MVLRQWNLDWLDANAERHYPLAASANSIDQTGSFVLPEDFIVGLYLPVSTAFNGASNQFFIQHIGNYANGYSVVIGYQPNTGGPITVASALINAASHRFGNEYALGGTGVFLDTFGWIQVGSLDNIDLQPQGFWTFDYANSQLEPDTIRPMIRGVVGIQVRTGNDVSQLLTGIVELVAGNNMQITPTVEEDGTSKLRFDAISGVGLNAECPCTGGNQQPITSINNVTPDSSGNLTVTGDSCLTVSPITNGLQFQDTCSAPCCACQELEVITRGLQNLGIEERSLQTFLNSLQNSVEAMDLTVLGSALNDHGCTTC